MEHRWGKRSKVDFPVRLSSHQCQVINGRLVDLSISGALLEADSEMRLFCHVTVSVIMPRAIVKIPPIASYVVRTHGHRAGVEWCEFASGATMQLLSIVRVRELINANTQPTSRHYY
jgi:hypothetical protein